MRGSKRSLSWALSLALSLTAGLCGTAIAQDDLVDLLRNVQENNTAEAKRNSEREQRFSAQAAQQKNLLKEAEDEVARQERLRDQLKSKFDANETLLGELQLLLDKRVGDLGELFGVFRQMADDTQTVLFDSLITLENPQRKTLVSSLAESTEVPTIPQMRDLWRLLIEESARSGQLSRFETEVVAPDGDRYAAQVTRVGTFNAISGDRYLNYLSESDQLIELSRQPAGYVRDSADDLSDAESGEQVGFYIDPSRGALLGLLVQSPSLTERIEQGKVVGYAIIIVGLIGMLIVSQRAVALARIRLRMDKQLKDIDSPRADNPLGRILQAYYENKHLNLETIKNRIEEIIFTDVAEAKKGLQVIKVLAAVAPLMGLLGTVTGMIGTFQAITLFGTGDPKLMAGGISQALITTVLGLCAAIPLLLSHSLLSSQVTVITKSIGEQFLSVVAEKAHSDATLKE